VLWLNVHGLHEPEVMAEIGRRFKLHPLVLEDILNTNQRPKIDDYGDYLFMVARFFEVDGENNQIGSDQVSLILGANFVLTFQERPSGRFDPLRERLRQNRGQIRQARRRLPRLFAARHHRRPLFHHPGKHRRAHRGTRGHDAGAAQRPVRCRPCTSSSAKP
jgi:Mg2+ and Co2+ transporter CorA